MILTKAISWVPPTGFGELQAAKSALLNDQYPSIIRKWKAKQHSYSSWYQCNFWCWKSQHTSVSFIIYQSFPVFCFLFSFSSISQNNHVLQNLWSSMDVFALLQWYRLSACRDDTCTYPPSHVLVNHKKGLRYLCSNLAGLRYLCSNLKPRTLVCCPAIALPPAVWAAPACNTKLSPVMDLLLKHGNPVWIFKKSFLQQCDPTLSMHYRGNPSGHGLQ